MASPYGKNTGIEGSLSNLLQTVNLSEKTKQVAKNFPVFDKALKGSEQALDRFIKANDRALRQGRITSEQSTRSIEIVNKRLQEFAKLEDKVLKGGVLSLKESKKLIEIQEKLSATLERERKVVSAATAGMNDLAHASAAADRNLTEFSKSMKEQRKELKDNLAEYIKSLPKKLTITSDHAIAAAGGAAGLAARLPGSDTAGGNLLSGAAGLLPPGFAQAAQALISVGSALANARSDAARLIGRKITNQGTSTGGVDTDVDQAQEYFSHVRSVAASAGGDKEESVAAMAKILNSTNTAVKDLRANGDEVQKILQDLQVQGIADVGESADMIIQRMQATGKGARTIAEELKSSAMSAREITQATAGSVTISMQTFNHALNDVASSIGSLRTNQEGLTKALKYGIIQAANLGFSSEKALQAGMAATKGLTSNYNEGLATLGAEEDLAVAIKSAKAKVDEAQAKVDAGGGDEDKKALKDAQQVLKERQKAEEDRRSNFLQNDDVAAFLSQSGATQDIDVIINRAQREERAGNLSSFKQIQNATGISNVQDAEAFKAMLPGIIHARENGQDLTAEQQASIDAVKKAQESPTATLMSVTWEAFQTGMKGIVDPIVSSLKAIASSLSKIPGFDYVDPDTHPEIPGYEVTEASAAQKGGDTGSLFGDYGMVAGTLAGMAYDALSPPTQNPTAYPTGSLINPSALPAFMGGSYYTPPQTGYQLGTSPMAANQSGEVSVGTDGAQMVPVMLRLPGATQATGTAANTLQQTGDYAPRSR